MLQVRESCLYKGQFTPLWIAIWCKPDQPTCSFWTCMWKCSTNLFDLVQKFEMFSIWTWKVLIKSFKLFLHSSHTTVFNPCEVNQLQKGWEREQQKKHVILTYRRQFNCEFGRTSEKMKHEVSPKKVIMRIEVTNLTIFDRYLCNQPLTLEARST